MKQIINTTPAAVADGAWKYARGVLVAFALGAIAALGGRGMVEAGIAAPWIWLWGIVAFVAFAGGLCFWAMHASTHWGADAAPTTTAAATEDRPVPAPPVGEPVEVPPGQIITFEDDSDRDYRRLVELHRSTGSAE